MCSRVCVVTCSDASSGVSGVVRQPVCISMWKLQGCFSPVMKPPLPAYAALNVRTFIFLVKSLCEHAWVSHVSHV